MLGLGWPVDLSSGLLLTLASFAALRDSLEALGFKLRLSAGALGSVITPMLTSMPKLMVVLCSIAAYGRAGGYDVTEGTVIGSPFVVSALALSALILVTGAVRGRRSGATGPS